MIPMDDIIIIVIIIIRWVIQIPQREGTGHEPDPTPLAQ